MLADRIRRHRRPLLVALSLIWAAVMVDTGDVAWPLAMWLTTTFIPLAVLEGRPDTGDHR